jgi:hypothetical protein
MLTEPQLAMIRCIANMSKLTMTPKKTLKDYGWVDEVDVIHTHRDVLDSVIASGHIHRVDLFKSASASLTLTQLGLEVL